jgi:hypothetical protein
MIDRYNLELQIEIDNNTKLGNLIDVNIITNNGNKYVLQGDPDGLVELDHLGQSIAIRFGDLKEVLK